VVPLQIVGENFVVNFPGTQFQTQEASVNIVRKSGLLGHFWTINLLENALCLLKNKDEIEARLEHMTEITEMPCISDWRLENIGSHSHEPA
jgi:hypothetical protein